MGVLKKINESLDAMNERDRVQAERRQIENKIEKLFYNELEIIVNSGQVDSKKVEKITLLKDLVKMFNKVPEQEVTVRVEKSY